MIACIPTKSRPTTKTYKLFEAVGIPVYHFIEPEQTCLYNVPNIIDIEKNNQGISYVRNFILDWAKDNNEWIVMCDDDVTDFGFAYGSKCITKDASILKYIYQKINKLPFEIAGLNYRQHAWHEKKEYYINKRFVEVCCLINTQKIRWRYRKEFNLKEDRDFVLQTIKYGNGVIKFNKLFYNCPGVGKNKGGLQNEYRNKKDEESSTKMIKEWHPYMQYKNKEGRIDIKFNFDEFCSDYKKIIK